MLAVSGTNLLAGTLGGGIFISTNNGTNWNQTGLTGTNVYSIAVHETNLFAGTSDGVVFLSTDNGTNWIAANTGLTNANVRSLAVVSTNLFAGTYGNAVWRRPLMELIPVELTSFTASVKPDGYVILNWSTATELNNSIFEIERRPVDGHFITIGFIEGRGTTTQPQDYSFVDNYVGPGTYCYRLKQIDFDGSFEYYDEIMVDVPSIGFELNQNYPNPFNPSTKIKFSIPASEFVSLKVFDLLGNKVATLINEEKPAGNYEVELNGAGLASGVYFYRLKAGNLIKTRKLVLAR